MTKSGRASPIHKQFVRYAVIGLSLNAALYAAYLLLTCASMSSRAAMTITYLAGVLIGFALNRTITFGFVGNQLGALSRYVVSYVIGYVVNWIGLWLLVDVAGFRHQIVQGFMIVVLAFTLFSFQRYWVFSSSHPELIQGV
jgi:putative flippase GtrA